MHGLKMPTEAVAERKENLYFGLLPQLKPVPEVLAHIDAQQGRIPFAVVSGSTRESIVKSLTTVGLLDRFSISIGSEDYALQTRSRRIPYAAARLGIAPKEGLVFEDTDAWASRQRRQPAWPPSAFPSPQDLIRRPTTEPLI